jgi:hypothetical protein
MDFASLMESIARPVIALGVLLLAFHMILGGWKGKGSPVSKLGSRIVKAIVDAIVFVISEGFRLLGEGIAAIFTGFGRGIATLWRRRHGAARGGRRGRGGHAGP